MLKWLFLLLLFSCQPTVDKIKVQLGLKKPENTNPTTEYVPPPPPTLEKDLVIKVDTRKRFISLLDGFTTEPDLQLKELVLEEYKSFSTSLTDKLDTQLASSLENLSSKFSSHNQLHLLLMYQLTKVLKGENKELSVSLLATGFEEAPREILDLMAKKSDDTNCDLVVHLKPNLTADDKKMIFSSRWNNLVPLKEFTRSEARLSMYLETCLARLKSEYQSSQETQPVVAPTAPEKESTPSP